MSGRRGRRARRSPLPSDRSALDRRLARWRRAVEIRADWQRHALRSAPADRAAAEAAITALYARVGAPPPAFEWVDSPAAALRSVPASTAPTPARFTAVEHRLASLMSSLRERLGDPLGVPEPRDPPSDPETALRSGAPLRPVLAEEVHRALRRRIRDAVAGPVKSALPGPTGLCWFGQHEVDWIAHGDVHRRLWRFDDTDALEPWALLARSAGWWWPREGRCVVAERPAAVRVEPMPGASTGELRLHAATGPAVVYPDGWAVHSWHGTRVPAWVIEDPAPERIAAERNVEVRRCAIERLGGWERYADVAGLALVGAAPDPGNPGCELHLYDVPYRQSGGSVQLLLAVNGSAERDGTRRRYGLHVPPWFRDPVDAAGWSYGLTGAQYARLLRRT
ncbi:DUF6745 domain-containing protein [Saccharopolyspora sp. CA-218241]|uniref:DUF6745 domain-containing protein n=1 Tax=Saccharopolyspora sp. CA-218241 TaxID=3240027 RepID=UPI003D959DF5